MPDDDQLVALWDAASSCPVCGDFLTFSAEDAEFAVVLNARCISFSRCGWRSRLRVFGDGSIGFEKDGQPEKGRDGR